VAGDVFAGEQFLGGKGRRHGSQQRWNLAHGGWFKSRRRGGGTPGELGFGEDAHDQAIYGCKGNFAIRNSLAGRLN
jgi:hypothetical protein